MTTALIIAGIAIAAVVGYGAGRLRHHGRLHRLDQSVRQLHAQMRLVQQNQARLPQRFIEMEMRGRR